MVLLVRVVLEAGGLVAVLIRRLIGELERLVLTLAVTCPRLTGGGGVPLLAERQLLMRMRLLRELLLVVAIR